MQKLITDKETYYTYQPAKNKKKGTIFFIHGYAVNSDYHYGFYNQLEDYDYYAVELPGHGITPLDSTWDLYPYKFAKKVAKLIRELDLTDIILIGHSMGGGINMMVQHMIPNRIKKAVIVTPMNSKGTTSVQNLLDFFFHFQPKEEKEIEYFYNVLMHDYQNNKQKITQDEIYHVLEMQNKYKHNFDKLKYHMCSASNMIHLEKAEKNLPRPTLLIVGKGDGCIDAKSTIKNLTNKNNKFGWFHVVEFEDAGHIPFLEVSEKYYKTIIKFIESKEKSPY